MGETEGVEEEEEREGEAQIAEEEEEEVPRRDAIFVWALAFLLRSLLWLAFCP